MDKKFDLFFSLGAACSCTEALRKAKLQFYSYPFDWVFGESFLDKINLITSDFANWLEFDYMEKVAANNKAKNPTYIYKNRLTNILFFHDFFQNSTIEKSFCDIKKKYDRRINRLLEHIKNSKKVLAVYIETPTTQKKLSDETILKGYNLLKDKFGDKIHLLYLYNAPGVSLKDMIISNLNKNVQNIQVDYNKYDPNEPNAINPAILCPIFNQFKVSSKYMNWKNRLNRWRYRIKLFLKGELFKKF